jgi:hypothetical protein
MQAQRDFVTVCLSSELSAYWGLREHAPSPETPDWTASDADALHRDTRFMAVRVSGMHHCTTVASTAG